MKSRGQQKHWNNETACFNRIFLVAVFFLLKGKNDGSGEENGEEVVNKPARTVPKKSRNPLLSEKYV